MADLSYTVPGLGTDDSVRLVETLQDRLHAMNDLQLTLKHAHWNVTGPRFIAVHEMIDPQVADVRGYADDLAERIAQLGASPVGTPGRLVSERSWNDYTLGKADTQEHLRALDAVYDGIIASNRKSITLAGELDPMTEDLLIEQTRGMEKFQWFMRAHLEGSEG
ncbi:DNA starvation/stationary phase protection protein Dps [Brachybacterium fresconis]|uniref:Starvation-inducible DNA-binding protein n=1 Tax=Brachybacterium fresconis TaxID=173363 RepID=A0ABS4YN31_9MICO|nr:DNA starvation/stationary phase protection protein Dps [Brachybacterium fresconis]MBP2410010.1 starvation-inducible DNA-binding protein [Brachybacterium fresconis]